MRRKVSQALAIILITTLTALIRIIILLILARMKATQSVYEWEAEFCMQ